MIRIITLLFLLPFVVNLSAQDKLKVACVGNSVTYGAGLADRETNAYPSQLQRMLGDRYEVGNFGHNGATLLNKGHNPYTRLEAYRQALAFAPDHVIIHLGINDTDPRNWPSYGHEFISDYLDLITSFRAVNANVRVYICQLSPITHEHTRFKSGTRDWYRQIQSLIRHIAKVADADLIDLQEVLYMHPDLIPDTLHPNITGAGIIAKRIYRAITGNYGGLQMPITYSDNMVLQRNKTIELGGTADAGEAVTVGIANQELTTYATPDGKWSVMLNPMKAATDLNLIIRTKTKTLKYKNVAVGEVWLCSGQSNMSFRVNQSATASSPRADNPNIRLFDMQPRWETNAVEWNTSVLDSLNRLEYYKDTKWQIADNESAMSFSAVAYYFGEKLADSLQVPIGLIHNSVGGSTTESWIDRSTIELHLPDILHEPYTNDFVMQWARERAKLNIRKSENKHQRHPYNPCYLFEAGIAPLQQYPINGVLWYQGESNAHNIELHEQLFSLLTDSWRRNWNNPSLPFHFVQLSSIDRPSWAHFRDSQRMLAERIPYTYMTVSSDLGDSLDVHPAHKLEIGRRLASSALHHTYAKRWIIPSGPVFKSVYRDGNSLLVDFDYANHLTSKGDIIVGLEIAGKDQLYKKAKGEIEGNRLRTSAPEVSEPMYIRYAYTPFTRANLQNETGMPVSTFQASLITEESEKMEIQSLANYPVSGGVSAPFVGVHNNRLIVIGGCNFVEKNGERVRTFYNDVYSLQLTDKPEQSKWVKQKSFPVEIAYGASVSTPEGIVCIGGNTYKGASNKAYLLSFDDKNNIGIKALPSLQYAVSNATATLLGRNVYLTGGAIDGETRNAIFKLDMDNLNKGWEQIGTPFEQERLQPVVFAQNNQLYMGGGYDEANARVFTDILQFDEDKKQWMPFTQIAFDANQPQAMIGASAVAYRNTDVLFVSGVNYDRFRSALQRISDTQKAEKDGNTKLYDELKEQGKSYMNQEPDWYKFRTQLLKLDASNKQWHSIGYFPQLARAGAGITLHNGKLYIVGGELKPGVRTQTCHYIQLD